MDPTEQDKALSEAKALQSFSPIRSYDKLDVAIAQMLEGELSASSAFALAFNPDRLTPEERTQLEDNLRKGEKGNSVTETALGIVSNPLTWFYFATGSAGANLASKGVGLFGRRAGSALGAMAKKSGDLLGTMDLLSGSQFLYDYPALRQGLEKMIKGIKEMQDEYLSGVSESAERVKKSTGLYKGINSKAYPKGSIERERAEMLERLIYAKSAGLHVTKDSTVLRARDVFRKRERVEVFDSVSGTTYHDWSDWTEIDINEYNELYQKESKLKNMVEADKRLGKASQLQGQNVFPDYQLSVTGELRSAKTGPHGGPAQEIGILDLQKMDAFLDQFDGVNEWIDANHKAVRRRMVRLYGKEGLGSKMMDLPDGRQMEMEIFEVDEDKARRLFAGLHKDFWSGNRKTSHQLGTDSEGMALLEKIVGPDAIRHLQTVPGGERQFLTQLKEVIERPMQDPYYVPRTLTKQKGWEGPNGKVYIKEEIADFDNPNTSGGDLISTESVVTPRVSKGLEYDVDDLEILFREFGADNDDARAVFNQMVKDGRQAEVSARRDGRSISLIDMNGGKVWDKFLKESGEIWAMHVQDAGRPLVAALRAEPGSGYDTNLQGAIDNVPQFVPQKNFTTSGQYRTGDISGGLQLGALSSTPKELSVADAVRSALSMVPDEHVISKVKNTLLPAITRRGVDNRHLIGLGQFMGAKRAMGWLAETKPMQKLMESGEWGKQFVQRLQVLADPDFEGFGGAGIATGLAKYLYGTHLGANLGSITLNLLQPFLLTGTALGFRHTIPAYVDAAKELGKYAELRSKRFGNRLFLKPEERLDLIRESFEFADEIGIEGDMLEQIDKFLINRASRTKGAFELYTVDLPMKMFEKSEWFARSVTSHAVKRQFKGAMAKNAKHVTKVKDAKTGRWIDHEIPIRMYDDAGNKTDFFSSTVKRATETFNFVPDEMGTVMAFLPSGKDAFMGRLMSNPLTRQFLSFGLRSFTGTMHTLPRLGGGTRRLLSGAGPEISNHWAVLGNDVMRGLGMSAIVYETGKGLLGADLSRSLFGSTLTDVGGFERMVQGDGGLPLPPAGDIPIQFLRAFMGSDMDLMGRTVSRLLPGGVSMHRLLGAAPDLGPASLLQKTHADWGNPLPDGSIAIYDGTDRLISYQRPQDIILKGLGVDLGRGQIAGNVDGYLLKQRDQINQYRRRYGEMILQGEGARAKRIAAEFQRRYGIPLTITENQLNNILRSKGVPRTERILDSVDKAIRPQMAGMVRGSQPFNVPEETLTQEATSRRRDPYREAPTKLTEEHLSQLRRMLQEKQQGGGYTPYEGF